MPFDKDVLWVGTDIGLLETTDGGASWNLRNDFISVAIFEMKIVNDQVVFATHGRGIWTATLSELSNYTLPSYLTSPDVTARQKSIDSFKAVISYNATTDAVTRAKIFVDGVEKSEVSQTFVTTTTYQFETEDLTEGKHTIGVQLFDDSVSLSTQTKEIEVHIIDYENASTNLSIAEFTLNDIYIFDNTFKVDNAQFFVDPLINTATIPYANNTTHAFILKKPLTLTSSNNALEYVDAAIVEPFDNPTSDLNQFYDYVSIEASSDLENWITIDKYDARRFSDWLDFYNNFGFLDETILKSQKINLSNKGLNTGDTYVFRFKLVSDANVNASGWFIKSINATTASIREVIEDKKDLLIYPTISNGNFTIFGNNKLGEAKVNITDITGKVIFNDKVNFTFVNEQKVNITAKPGVYFVNINGDSNIRISRKIIIK
jgi:hypothetical protein